MGLQNRVLPDGMIVASKNRGTLMGNRGGRIHDPDSQKLLKRRWVGRRWICCELSFRNRQRQVMGNGYTELFFLDEVTALAAGHRPCFECRRQDAVHFSKLWRDLFPLQEGSVADQIDFQLHGERTEKRIAAPKVRCVEMVPAVVYRNRDGYFTIRDGKVLKWNLGGYEFAEVTMDAQELVQITPASIAAVISAGYKPRWHPSAVLGRKV